MSRYIDVEDFSQMVYENFGRDGEFDYRDLIRILSEQPTADVKEVVRGEWKYNGEKGEYVCTNCNNWGADDDERTYFCPNCGADMREKPTDKKQIIHIPINIKKSSKYCKGDCSVCEYFAYTGKCALKTGE